MNVAWYNLGMNENIYLIVIALFVILLIALLIFIIFLFMHQNNQIKQLINHKKIDDLNDTQALKDNINDELSSFSNELKEFTTNRLKDIEQTMNLSLIHNFDKTERIMISMSEKMTTINQTQNDLKDLSKDLLNLQNILNDKKTRGIFGEVELYSLLEKVYGVNDQIYARQYKLSNGAIADAVIKGSDDLSLIVIDSKFPLENYMRMHDENLSKEERLSAQKVFKGDLKKHIDDIASKYLIEEETAEMAYMFIPAESIFADIYARLYDIIEYAYRKHVYIVSPTTLLAYITALKAIHLGHVRDLKVKEIQTEYVKLNQEFKRFEERLYKLDSDFNKVHDDFKNVLITTNKMLKRFEMIEKIEIEQGE